MPADEPQWLRIARELRAIAQTGLAFTTDRQMLGAFRNGREHIRQRRIVAAPGDAILTGGIAQHDGFLG